MKIKATGDSGNRATQTVGANSTARDDESTRERVAEMILQTGPATAATLAHRMRLTPAAIRRHLDELEAEGIISGRGQRVTGPRGRGRPAKEFAITDAGRDHFAHAYDELAVDALRYLADTGGNDAVNAFARQRLNAMEQRYRPLMQEVAPGERPTKLAEALTADGYAATTDDGPNQQIHEDQGSNKYSNKSGDQGSNKSSDRHSDQRSDRDKNTGNGIQICQHHCPVAHVAEEFAQLCEAETEMFSRLLGTHVQRLATIAHGDGVCTTYLPDPDHHAQSPAERLST